MRANLGRIVTVMWVFMLGTMICIAASPGIAPAQQPDQNATPEPRSQTLHAASRLVQLNVLVHDLKGAPVRDLTKDDFVVLDEGRERRVAIFRMEEERAAKAAGAAAHPLSLNNRGFAEAERPAAATIILVDSLNIASTDDLLYVKRELPKFLKNLQPGDPVAIYTLVGPTVRVIHEFSDNSESLIHSAERGPGAVSQWLGASGGAGVVRFEQRLKAEWTLAALESIALHLADISGRKTLVWIHLQRVRAQIHRGLLERGVEGGQTRIDDHRHVGHREGHVPDGHGGDAASRRPADELLERDKHEQQR